MNQNLEEMRHLNGQTFFGFILLTKTLMNQSQKLLTLQNILAESSQLKHILEAITQVAKKYDDFSTANFSHSQDFHRLVQVIDQLRMPQINQILEQMKQPDSIVALPIKMEAKYTLFFVVVPAGQKFDWHSHPKMAGVSKCIHGSLHISTIDIKSFIPYQQNSYIYPKNRLRSEIVKADQEKTVSTIQPQSFNIHKIEAQQLSAFFDLLMPDYPENNCQFFRTAQENEQQILLQQIQGSMEVIKGWDTVLNDLLFAEKHVKKNYILK